MKKAIVMCEVSGVWAGELHRAGFDVTQVDLKLTPANLAPSWRTVGTDVREFVGEVFDVAVGFPPCTDLSAAGARYWKTKNLYGGLALAAAVASIAAGARVAGLVENPQGLMSRILGKPDCTVHPWQFAGCPGEHVMKRTCLWLFGCFRPPFMRGFAGYVNRPRTMMEWRPKFWEVDSEQRASACSVGWQGMAAEFVSQLAGGVK